ncbi:MAG: VWA domain-containing protein [Planctomycetota bacterium]
MGALWIFAPLALAPTVMSLGLVLGGLAGFAGLIFALQRLRVRHRSRVVVTTLFWREAVEESRARTLVERFRHPSTYLLLFAIAGLLWLSVARLAADRSEGIQHTFLLDGSANMAAGSRFEDATRALLAALEGAPPERTQVLICGSTVRSLLAPGDDRALLKARLEGVRPEAVPASVERALVDALAERRGPQDGAASARRFAVFGHAPVSDEALADLGEADVFERFVATPGQASSANGEASAAGRSNLGIVALGAAPAASGVFDAVDLYIEVQGDDAKGANLSVTLGGEPVTLTRLGSPQPDAARWAVRDLRPLEAGMSESARTVAAALVGATSGDGLGFDDSATLVLPELRLIRVHIEQLGSSEAEAAIRAACEADAAVELIASPERADVLITSRSLAHPSLRVAEASEASASIEVRLAAGTALLDGQVRASDRPGHALVKVLGELGLDRVDATRLASELGRPLEARLIEGSPGEGRSLALWSELLRPDLSSFTESRAFPAVVGRALRWLAETPEVVPYRAAGRPVPKRLTGSRPPRVDLASLPAEPASLLDASSTRLARTASADGGSAETPMDDSGPWRLSSWVLLIALALLVGEWLLFQRGRIA